MKETSINNLPLLFQSFYPNSDQTEDNPLKILFSMSMDVFLLMDKSICWSMRDLLATKTSNLSCFLTIVLKLSKFLILKSKSLPITPTLIVMLLANESTTNKIHFLSLFLLLSTRIAMVKKNLDYFILFIFYFILFYFLYKFFFLKGGLSKGALIGIIVGAVGGSLIVISIVGLILWKRRVEMNKRIDQVGYEMGN